MTLEIPGRLPSLNDIIALAKQGRGSYQPYALIKSTHENVICIECKRQKLKSIGKCDVTITWVCKDKRRDKDNIIAGGTKLILDSLQKAGIIKNDNWSCIGDITHKFQIAEKEKIVVELEEIL